jgi:hypothetical protein
LCGRINAKSSARALHRRTENVVLKANQNDYFGRRQRRPLMPPSTPHSATPADSGIRSSIVVNQPELSDPVEDQKLGSNTNFELVMTRLNEIDAKLDTLVEAQKVKDWYTTAEIAQIVAKSEYTVREWCRHGRIKAVKRKSGRGPHAAWVVSHDELERYECEGLLPIPTLNR